ncbi:MAG: FkbM family methyltransferase [Microcoleaceae cyanobacterium]
MLHELLSDTSILQEKNFVLVDIGASGAPPVLWQKIAPFSNYVGFDPDARALNEENAYSFQTFTLIKKIVTEGFSDQVDFFLTSYPYCSSTLKPDFEYCQHYTFTETFEVIDQTQFPATRLDTVVKDLGIHGIDWLKLDSQGKDLDLFLSIDQSIRDRMLAIDIEPGVVPFYQGENTFDETHSALLKQGFWLSDIQLQNGGFPRIKQSTRQKLANRQLQPQNQAINFEALPVSPTALEARYLRTIEHLNSVGADLRDYFSLWVFALLDNQLGFALDVALHVIESYPSDSLGNLLLDKTLEQVAVYQNSSGA